MIQITLTGPADEAADAMYWLAGPFTIHGVTGPVSSSSPVLVRYMVTLTAHPLPGGDTEPGPESTDEPEPTDDEKEGHCP